MSRYAPGFLSALTETPKHRNTGRVLSASAVRSEAPKANAIEFQLLSLPKELYPSPLCIALIGPVDTTRQRIELAGD